MKITKLFTTLFALLIIAAHTTVEASNNPRQKFESSPPIHKYRGTVTLTNTTTEYRPGGSDESNNYYEMYPYSTYHVCIDNTNWYFDTHFPSILIVGTEVDIEVWDKENDCFTIRLTNPNTKQSCWMQQWK